MVDYSKSHQLRWKGNLGTMMVNRSEIRMCMISHVFMAVRGIVTDERKYYLLVLEYSKANLLVRLSDSIAYY